MSGNSAGGFVLVRVVVLVLENGARIEDEEENDDEDDAKNRFSGRVFRESADFRLAAVPLFSR